MEIVGRDGAVIMSGLLSDRRPRLSRGELDTLFQRTGPCVGLFLRRQDQTYSLAGRANPEPATMIMVPQVLVEIMNRHSRAPTATNPVEPDPGHTDLAGRAGASIHRDDSMFPIAQAVRIHGERDVALSARSPQDNGATIIVPGSHKWDDKARVPAEGEITQAAMKAGEVLIYLGSVIHAGGAEPFGRAADGRGHQLLFGVVAAVGKPVFCRAAGGGQVFSGGVAGFARVRGAASESWDV